MYILLTICLIATLAISMINVVSAAEITISSTTPGGLKQAIETAKNGTTINLENGVYKGNNNTNITIKKNIKINGLGSKVVLDGEKKNQIFQIKGEFVSLKNLKFANGLDERNFSDSNGYENTIGDGGAIINSGTLTITGCTFTNNQAYAWGGAIYNSGFLRISDCTFKNNKADVGGAIHSDNILVISKSTLSKNKATFGGAIHSHNKLTISKSIFSNNNAKLGGAIDSAGNLTVSACSFKNNKAENTGGSIFSEGNLKVTLSTLTSNTGKWGGAIFSYNNSIVKSSTFKNNIARSLGGAIETQGKNTVKMCTFKNNKANNGGAIASSAKGSISKNSFKNNIANRNGGAIYFDNELSSSPNSNLLTMSKSTFQNNKAFKKGGAIFNKNFEKIKIINSKFTKNIADKKFNAISTHKKIKITKKNVSISPKDGSKLKKIKK